MLCDLQVARAAASRSGGPQNQSLTRLSRSPQAAALYDKPYDYYLVTIYDFTRNQAMTFPTGPAVQLGTGDRGFALLKEVGEDRNILRIKCA